MLCFSVDVDIVKYKRYENFHFPSFGVDVCLFVGSGCLLVSFFKADATHCKFDSNGLIDKLRISLFINKLKVLPHQMVCENIPVLLLGTCSGCSIHCK